MHAAPIMLTLTRDNLIRLAPGMEIGPFDCGDADLNEFLLKDAKAHLTQLLAVTYLVRGEAGNVAAFFSLSNDRLTCDPTGDGKTVWNRLQRQIPNDKRRRTYPAVKIGRLGVHVELQKSGLGRQVLDYLKMLFVTNNRTGCRFIIVDAYNAPAVVAFYQRNHFRFLSSADEGADTRQMYFDLMPFADLSAAQSV